MIKVIGIGDCGGNVVQRMVSESIAGVEFIAAGGLAQEAAIQQVICGADTVLIIAGMGSVTGAAAATAVAKTAQRMEKFTLAVVTTPFLFEEDRKEAADRGVAELTQEVDSLIAIPNHKLVCEGVSQEDLFEASANMLCGAVRDVVYAITRPGAIHDGFSDVRVVMSGSCRGLATVGIGQAAGGDRARLATEAAIDSPLLDNRDLRRANGVLVNVTIAGNLRVSERRVVVAAICEAAAKDSTIVLGISDQSIGESMRVIVVATGLRIQPWRIAEEGDSRQFRKIARASLEAVCGLACPAIATV